MLWLAGRWRRETQTLDFVAAGKLVCATVAGTAGFFFFSNLGYYIGGGYADQMGVAEYASRVLRYFPHYLTVTLAYGAAGIVLLALAQRLAPRTAAAR
jgi:hypothetical protein